MDAVAMRWRPGPQDSLRRVGLVHCATRIHAPYDHESAAIFVRGHWKVQATRSPCLRETAPDRLTEPRLSFKI